MNKVRSIFEQGLNSILSLSKLAADIEDLRRQFNTLRGDNEYLRNRNAELDTALADVRVQRDTAMRERDEAHAELSTLAHDLDLARSGVRDRDAQIKSLQEDLDRTRLDRDQAYDAWHKIGKEKDEAEGKLNAIAEFAQRAFGFVLPAKAEPIPATTPVTETAPSTVQTAPINAESKWVYEGEAGFDWTKQNDNPPDFDSFRNAWRQRA